MPETQMRTRRTMLSTLGAAFAGGCFGTTVSARDRQTRAFAISQADRCVPVEPIRGSEPVELLYDYRLPEKYVSDANGASAGTSALYSSAGTTALQRPQTSVAFLYQGPDRLSLVLVHGSLEAADGGSVSFTFEGLPAAGRWAVRDDLYRDPDTGEIASTNYDRWDVDGSEQTVDWTWGSAGTDGGAFAGLGVEFDVAVEPAFNEAATLAGRYYDGTITDWTFVSGPLDDARRFSLSMDDTLRIRTGDCGSGDDASQLTGGDEDDEDAAGKEADEGEHIICHRPPGNPDNAKTKVVGSQSAVEAHTAHGDSTGPCSGDG